MVGVFEKLDAKQLILNRDFIFPVDGTEFLPLSSQKAFNEGKFNKGLSLNYQDQKLFSFHIKKLRTIGWCEPG